MSLYTSIAPVAKAVTGAVVAGLGALGTALIADESGNVAVTAGEWVAVATATLVASYAVWQIPNEDPAAEHQDESVQPADGDHNPFDTL